MSIKVIEFKRLRVCKSASWFTLDSHRLARALECVGALALETVGFDHIQCVSIKMIEESLGG